MQGYAHAEALAGADLLEAYDGHEENSGLVAAVGVRSGRPVPPAFLGVSDDLGPYPVIALDQRELVTGVASNMGHLLGTGILNEEESAAIVARLLDPTMFSGYGVRTMSNTNGASWPYRYHVGSVWTHDTAVIIDGMLDEVHRRGPGAGQRPSVRGGRIRLQVAVGNLFGGVRTPPPSSRQDRTRRAAARRLGQRRPAWRTPGGLDR